MGFKQLITACGALLLSSTAMADKPYPMTQEQRASLDEFISHEFPSFDVYIAPIEKIDSGYAVQRPENITNRKLFDGAAQFAHDGSLMIYSVMEDVQIDIHRYVPETKTLTRLTHTPESEFSPRLMSDGKNFTAMRLEAPYVDRIWQYPLSENAEPEIVFHVISPIGWHTWYDDNTALLVIETFPGYKDTETGMLKTFAIANRGRERVHKIQDGVGSCTAPTPYANAASFVSVTGDVPQLKSVNLENGSVSVVSDMPGGGANPCFAYAPNGDLLMMRGTEVWMRSKRESGYADWKQTGDLAEYGISGRVILTSVSPDGKSISFVANH